MVITGGCTVVLEWDLRSIQRRQENSFGLAKSDFAWVSAGCSIGSLFITAF